MLVLGLDAALARCSAALVRDGVTLGARETDGGGGQASALPQMLQHLLADLTLCANAIEVVAVTVGPGSFTGLRAALSFGHGLAAALGCPVVGVTVAEALAEASGNLEGRALWTAVDARANRVFLARDGDWTAVSLDALPHATGRVAVAGDAAIAVAARLAARGLDVKLTDARQPHARHAAAAGARRLAGALPPLAATPLYIDAPLASQPKGGLRASPQRQGPVTPHSLVAAGEAHAAAMAAIHALAFPPAQSWDQATFAGLLMLPGAVGLIEGAGALVLARCAADEAEILTLAVAPALRRRGIARALLAGAEAMSAARGARTMFLEVAADNAAACALYAAAGYAQVGTRRAYYPGAGDARVLARALSRAAAAGG